MTTNSTNIKLTAILILLASICNAQNYLQYYISSAINSSPVINENKNLSEAAKIEVDRLKAQFTKPEVYLAGAYLFAPYFNNNGQIVSTNPDANAIGYDIGITNGGLYSGTVNVVMPVFNGRRCKANADQVLIQALNSMNNIKLTTHELEKLVTVQYILCYQDYQQIQYTEEILKLLNEQKKLVAELVKSGLIKQSDYTLMNIELQTQQVVHNQLEANYKKDILQLNVLCGIRDTSSVQIVPPDLTLNERSKQSMFLEKYRLDSLNIAVQQKISELKYKPQIDLFADAGLNAIEVANIQRKFGFSAGVNFSFNLFDGGQKSFNRQKTKLILQSVKAYKLN